MPLVGGLRLNNSLWVHVRESRAGISGFTFATSWKGKRKKKVCEGQNYSSTWRVRNKLIGRTPCFVCAGASLLMSFHPLSLCLNGVVGVCWNLPAAHTGRGQGIHAGQVVSPSQGTHKHTGTHTIYSHLGAISVSNCPKHALFVDCGRKPEELEKTNPDMRTPHRQACDLTGNGSSIVYSNVLFLGTKKELIRRFSSKIVQIPSFVKHTHLFCLFCRKSKASASLLGKPVEIFAFTSRDHILFGSLSR